MSPSSTLNGFLQVSKLLLQVPMVVALRTPSWSIPCGLVAISAAKMPFDGSSQRVYYFLVQLSIWNDFQQRRLLISSSIIMHFFLCTTCLATNGPSLSFGRFSFLLDALCSFFGEVCFMITVPYGIWSLWLSRTAIQLFLSYTG